MWENVLCELEPTTIINNNKGTLFRKFDYLLSYHLDEKSNINFTLEPIQRQLSVVFSLAQSVGH